MANPRKSASTPFKKSESYSPRNNREKLLVEAIRSVKTSEEAAALLRDLLTPAEITEFANRITMAGMLLDGQSYLKIAKEMKTSTTTVTRVAHWLFTGCGGYYRILKRILRK